MTVCRSAEGFRSSSDFEAMIIPGVQNPHWKAVWSTKASWMGLELSGAFVGQTLYGGELPPVTFYGQGHTGQYRRSVHDDRAGTTGTLIAPDLGPGQIESFSEGMRQGMRRRDLQARFPTSSSWETLLTVKAMVFLSSPMDWFTAVSWSFRVDGSTRFERIAEPALSGESAAGPNHFSFFLLILLNGSYF